MIDLARDELKEILDMINDINNGSQAHGLELHFQLRDKIQSMIDNYCEHNQIAPNWGPNTECVDCGEIW